MSNKKADNLEKWRNELRNLKFEHGLITSIIDKSPESFTLTCKVVNDTIMINDKVITGKTLLSLQSIIAESIRQYEETIEFYQAQTA